MARGEITGQKPRSTVDPPKRRSGPPCADDPEAIEPTPHDECTAKAKPKASPIRGPPVAPAAYSIATFCAAHHLSQAMYFKLKAQGIAPVEMHVGSRVLISFESASQWRREREAETAAKRQQHATTIEPTATV
jgi:hypothetical protein